MQRNPFLIFFLILENIFIYFVTSLPWLNCRGDLKRSLKWGSSSSLGLEKILLRETPSGGPLPRHGWIRKILWRKQWQPTPVVLPGEFHGKRSLGGFIQSMGSQRVRHSWVTERAHTLSHNSGGQGMYLIMSLILPAKVSTSLDTGVNEKQTVTARI